MTIAILIGCATIAFNGYMLLSQHNQKVMGPILISIGSIGAGMALLAIKGGAQ